MTFVESSELRELLSSLTGFNKAIDEGGDVYDARAVYISWVVLGLGCGAGYLEWRRRRGPQQLPAGGTAFQPLEEEIALAMAQAGAVPGQQL